MHHINATRFLIACAFLAGFHQLNAQNIAADKRLAIVIGNSKYVYSGELPNPVNDARAMRDALQGLGFDVLEYENLSQGQMKMAIDEFGSKLRNYTTGLFFYAGHGIQSKGANYLVPVDANIQAEQQIEYDCVQADRVLGFMEAAGSRINIVILDACRNNPFERSWSRGMEGSGLAFMNAPAGSLIAYSTSPGRTASDGSGSNGLYTSALLENMKTPDITILQMFQNVRRNVADRSFKKQIPWESTSLTDDFYFVNAADKGKENSSVLTWMHVDDGKPGDDGYYFYINGENATSRIDASWIDDSLLVYDPVTNISSMLENYKASPKNSTLTAKNLGNSSNAFCKVNDKGYYFYIKGKFVSDRTNFNLVDKDLLIFDPETNTTYIFRDYARDQKLRPAEVLDNAGFAFWRKTKENAFWLLVKGEYMQNRTNNDYAGNDLVAYDTVSRITYVFKDFLIDTIPLQLRKASILSYQDDAFWMKTEEGYYLIVKGRSIQNHLDQNWSGDDLYARDTRSDITYILPDYKNASLRTYRVALVKP
jgi:hypothetical protein